MYNTKYLYILSYHVICILVGQNKQPILFRQSERSESGIYCNYIAMNSHISFILGYYIIINIKKYEIDKIRFKHFFQRTNFRVCIKMQHLNALPHTDSYMGHNSMCYVVMNKLTIATISVLSNISQNKNYKYQKSIIPFVISELS